MKKLLWIVLILSGCGQVELGAGGLISPGGEQPAVVEEKLSPEGEYLASLPEEYRRLTVPYMRQQVFPGSEIEIGRQVSETGSYVSYLASYESEGLRINGLLTRPKTAEPAGGYPAVVFVHGYIPPLTYETTEKYGDYVDYLARNGIVVFKIDLRGHGESEGEPGGAYYSADYVYDTLNARASLQKLAYVNPQKVGLWGHSMAGNVVLRAMAVKPEIHAGVIWAGAVYTYTDMREFGIEDNSYQPSQNPNRGRRDEMYETVGEVEEEGNEFWPMVAPANYVGELEGLVSLHHATADPVVAVEYSRNLVERMKGVGANYEFFEYGSGGHNLGTPAFGVAMGRSVEALVGE